MAGKNPQDWLNFLDVDKFIENSALQDGNGLLRPNRFLCLLNAPKIPMLGDNGWLEWQVLSVSCPNIGLDTESMEVNSWPHYYLKTRNDTDFTITFLETAEMTVRTFFYSWMNYGFNQMSGRRSYIDDVEAKEMKVIPLNWKGEGIKADCFYGVFPIDISGIEYDFGTDDTMLKTTVKFRFMFHTVEWTSSRDNYHDAAFNTNAKNSNSTNSDSDDLAQFNLGNRYLSK